MCRFVPQDDPFFGIIGPMKPKSYLAAALVAVLAAVSGCVSIDRCGAETLGGLSINGTDAKPVEHIVVSNFGYYLFNIFPLVSGNANPDRWFPILFFSDHVKLPKMQTLLAAEVQKRQGVEIAELTSNYDAAPCFSVSLDPKSLLGLLFCYREIQVSAVLVEEDRTKEAGGYMIKVQPALPDSVEVRQ